MMFTHKYNETAFWSRAMLSNDSEQSRSALSKKPFQCYEFDLTQTNQHTPIDKMLAKTQTIGLCTYDAIALQMETDDTVEFYNTQYSVVNIKKMKNLQHPNRHDYLIVVQLGG